MLSTGRQEQILKMELTGNYQRREGVKEDTAAITRITPTNPAESSLKKKLSCKLIYVNFNQNTKRAIAELSRRRVEESKTDFVGYAVDIRPICSLSLLVVEQNPEKAPKFMHRP